MNSLFFLEGFLVSVSQCHVFRLQLLKFLRKPEAEQIKWRPLNSNVSISQKGTSFSPVSSLA